MVRQIVLMRWTADASDEAKRAVAEALLGLKDKIDGIRDVRLGSDLRIREDNFDFAVSVDFDDKAGYMHYRNHPAHIRVVEELIRPVMAERTGVVFDCR